MGFRSCFLHVHGSSAFLLLGKFLRFVFDDSNPLFCEAVELIDQLVDLLVGGADLVLDHSLLEALSYRDSTQGYCNRAISVVWPRSSLTTTNFPLWLGVNCSFAFSNSIP